MIISVGKTRRARFQGTVTIQSEDSLPLVCRQRVEVINSVGIAVSVDIVWFPVKQRRGIHAEFDFHHAARNFHAIAEEHKVVWVEDTIQDGLWITPKQFFVKRDDDLGDGTLDVRASPQTRPCRRKDVGHKRSGGVRGFAELSVPNCCVGRRPARVFLDLGVGDDERAFGRDTNRRPSLLRPRIAKGLGNHERRWDILTTRTAREDARYGKWPVMPFSLEGHFIDRVLCRIRHGNFPRCSNSIGDLEGADDAYIDRPFVGRLGPCRTSPGSSFQNLVDTVPRQHPIPHLVGLNVVNCDVLKAPNARPPDSNDE